MQFAAQGRWRNFLGNDPLQTITQSPELSAIAMGTGAAGAATLGNIVSGEAQGEGPGRSILEALGAGALGAAVGSQVPQLRIATKQSLNDWRTKQKNVANAAKPKEGTSIPFMDEVNAKYGGRNAHLIGAAGTIGLGTLAAGGLGGQIGGGNANIGNMLGIAGMQPNTIVDPEAYGSSNLRVY